MTNEIEQTQFVRFVKPSLVPGSIFIFAFSIALLSTGYGFPGGDARYYTTQTRALALDGTWDCSNTGLKISRGNINVGKDGKIYTKYPVGQSLAQVPLYYLFNQITPFLKGTKASFVAESLSLRTTSALLTAFAVTMLFFLLTYHFHFSITISTIVSLMYLFCTQASLYSKINYSEALQAALLITITFVLLVPKRNVSLVLFSFLFGYLVITKPVLLLTLPVFLYLFFVNRIYEGNHFLSWILSIVLILGFGSFLGFYNHLRNGSIFDFGYEPGEFHAFQDPRLFFDTFISLFVYPNKSIFIFSPTIVLFLAGLFLLKNKTYRIFVGTVWVMLMIIFSFHGVLYSGHYGQRYMVPVIILTMPFVAAVLTKVSNLPPLQKYGAMAPIVILALFSAYISILGVTYFHFTADRFCDTYNAIAEKNDQIKCGESFLNNQPMIYHYLLWNDAYPEKPEHYDEFPWIEGTFTPTLATQVLNSPGLKRQWVRKDLLFFEPENLKEVGSIRMIKFGLFVLMGLSIAAWIAGHSGSPRTQKTPTPEDNSEPKNQEKQNRWKATRRRLKRGFR